MAKKRNPYARHKNRANVDLTNAPDTSKTNDPITEKSSKRKRSEHYESVEPPFQNNEKEQRPITWGELSSIWKVVVGVVTFFITIVLPIIWFASSINTNVSILQDDVKDVKNKTEELVVNSVKNSQRLNSLESNISTINKQLISNSRNKSTTTQKTPKTNAPADH